MSEEKKDGGPAFPIHKLESVFVPAGSDSHYENALALTGGLTKRDWFAGMALQGILAGKYGEIQDMPSDRNYKDGMARISFEFADSMLKESEK